MLSNSEHFQQYTEALHLEADKMQNLHTTLHV
jgi:hypothetical protein